MVTSWTNEIGPFAHMTSLPYLGRRVATPNTKPPSTIHTHTTYNLPHRRNNNTQMNYIKQKLGFRIADPHKTCIYIEGYAQCGYFLRAAHLAKDAERLHPSELMVTVETHAKDDYPKAMHSAKDTLGSDAENHHSCPIVYEGCGKGKQYIGGYIDLVRKLNRDFGYLPR